MIAQYYYLKRSRISYLSPSINFIILNQIKSIHKKLLHYQHCLLSYNVANTKTNVLLTLPQHPLRTCQTSTNTFFQQTHTPQYKYQHQLQPHYSKPLKLEEIRGNKSSKDTTRLNLSNTQLYSTNQKNYSKRNRKQRAGSRKERQETDNMCVPLLKMEKYNDDNYLLDTKPQSLITILYENMLHQSKQIQPKHGGKQTEGFQEMDNLEI
eukprot:TRINITY_DN21416_c0_g1_i1.p1 TRINITY_DN21416_c0_g1~~TRINITY_DN21416_c0_g1_i1.p1  ORF type:complete len:240 (+),score=-2.36 TRINITY_DN21416_c0_g1_i1:94-720(+)